MRHLFIVLLIDFLNISCTNNKSKNEVVIYTSVDQVFSSQILKEFEAQTGICFKVVYDTEVSKVGYFIFYLFNFTKKGIMS